MSINSKLDILFDKWANEPRFKDGNFFRDGIINEDIYSKQKLRVLFIAKEPNYKNHEDKVKDFRIQWNKEIPDYRIAKQIAKLSYGIRNKFPLYDKIETSIEDLQSIAFMNIKKSAGDSVSAEKDFQNYLSENNHLDFIREEIELINPELILLGLTWDKIRNNIFKGLKWTTSGLDIEYAKDNGRTIIDYYHPSSFIPPNVDYYFLKTVLEHIK